MNQIFLKFLQLVFNILRGPCVELLDYWDDSCDKGKRVNPPPPPFKAPSDTHNLLCQIAFPYGVFMKY